MTATVVHSYKHLDGTEVRVQLATNGVLSIERAGKVVHSETSWRHYTRHSATLRAKEYENQDREESMIRESSQVEFNGEWATWGALSRDQRAEYLRSKGRL